MRFVRSVGLVLVLALVVAAAGCSGASDATAVPTAPPPTQTTSAPASTSTVPPTLAPTAAPTEAPTEPPAAATATSSSATVTFNWAPGSVTPADADDVTEIINDLKRTPGILGGFGDETVLSVQYDPALITVEEIAALLETIGHPVVQQ